MLVTSLAFGQQSPNALVSGRVSSSMSDLEGVYVINLKTEKMVQTDKKGDFTIAAVKGDSLIFSMFQYTRLTLALTDENLRNGKLEVNLFPLMNYLDEVIIGKYSHINAVNLGIIPAGQRSYTAAERKLMAAGDFSGSGGASVGLDPLLNLFSGRTTMLKKELAVEKKEKFMLQLEYMFDEAHYVTKLKIPLIYIRGFMYYAVENPKFTRVLETKNKVSIEFLLGQLAEMYKETITVESK
ncbi:carboxypeptidase-like regulatory domain-containing protein [Flavobacterium sp. 7A]|uniref:carboxypeptidase-like regulatory domain-containing protein n=1 Tax=Flavobacterium sp. 7A TaxID=2940571 RepID=UPI0022277C56|nr:carboxypeptidase-like regulatory domain-containing protein [Flavobacterium sp. 7A]MCW2120256.1 hypothetical protein [Flavobacterium sp. 7A]